MPKEKQTPNADEVFAAKAFYNTCMRELNSYQYDCIIDIMKEFSAAQSHRVADLEKQVSQSHRMIGHLTEISIRKTKEINELQMKDQRIAELEKEKKEIIFELQKIALADDYMVVKPNAAIIYRTQIREILDKINK